MITIKLSIPAILGGIVFAALLYQLQYFYPQDKQWIMGFLSGIILTHFFRFMNNLKEAKKIMVGDKPCPHGYEDWDNCPDCCH